MHTQVKALIRTVAISAFITVITACGGSDSDPLPGANSSLDTQTLEGIWFIKSSQTGNYTSDDTNTDLNTVKEVHQFVNIIELANGSYVMPECGLDLLINNEHFVLAIEGKGVEVLDSESSLQSGSNKETYSLNLLFEDNLKFSGTIDVVNQNGKPDFTYQDVRHAIISAVKVSDSRDFYSANELAIEFSAQLNNDAELTLSDIYSDVSCLATSSSNHAGNKVGISISIEQETMVVLDNNGNKARFSVENGNLGADAIVHNSYTSSLTSLLSSGEVSCGETNESCALTTSFELSQSSTSNSITANAAASNENDESLNISFSVEIK